MLVNMLEAKNQLSRLVKKAQAGEEVIIANRGEPVARLVGAGPADRGSSAIGNGRTIIEWLDNHPLPDYARRSEDEIDAAVAEERESWG